MPAWICVTCAVQYPDTEQPPAHCPVCEDERQYVGPEGQRWTTMGELARDHTNELREEEPDLVGIGVSPSVAIGQRALLVRTPHGNVLWDCVPLLDDDAKRRIAGLGGIDAICMSHPHFYGAHIEFAEAFDARVLIPRADQQWVQRPSPRIELFDDDIEPVPGITLARIGGHFDGASVLHWPAGSAGRGALLTGDTVAVVQDRRWVSFMWSFPNFIPLDEHTVDDIARRVGRFAFDRVYGGWWGRVVIGDGAAAVRRSADRYIARLRGERPAGGEPRSEQDGY
ncbi:MBL fold metallo-hydrolase [Streptomyces sp. NBC_01197]|uniref:MBL fold metallo-hydrolase n=1 Tax=Streptomyces sp. NBC_01197 TaxID=2903768 RepID=UPI002E11BE02|nr:MBL fold metallo-hydrolase [Streptomyces sp. NBC_01197]